jgi:2'-5' RNA ligase
MDAPNSAPSSAQSSESARLFLALWPDPAMRQALRTRRDAWTWPRGATPVADSKLHLTLHFLGNQPRARLAELLDGFGVPFTPFSLRLATPELWHNGIAVLAPQAAPQPLLDLHARLSEALLALGLQPEPRAYRPHVTMARRAGGAAIPPSGAPLDWQIDRYALVESQAGNGGYTVLREYC